MWYIPLFILLHDANFMDSIFRKIRLSKVSNTSASLTLHHRLFKQCYISFFDSFLYHVLLLCKWRIFCIFTIAVSSTYCIIHNYLKYTLCQSKMRLSRFYPFIEQFQMVSHYKISSWLFINSFLDCNYYIWMRYCLEWEKA